MRLAFAFLLFSAFLSVPSAFGQSRDNLAAQTSNAQASLQRASVTTDAPLFVRPDANLTPLRVARAGTVINVLSSEGDWYQVEFQDPQYGRRVGFIHKSQARLMAAPLPEPMDLSIRDSAAEPARPNADSARGLPPLRIVEGSGTPAAELSIGYTVLFGGDEAVPMGWYADVAGNPTSNIGLVGQVTGSYKSVTESGIDALLSIYSFMGGARVNGRFQSATPFFHVLFGGIRASGSTNLDGRLPYNVGVSQTQSVVQIGGGVNVLGSQAATGVRLGGDYLQVLGADGGYVVRVSAGIVLPFGNR
jgi:hypothetical protein